MNNKKIPKTNSFLFNLEKELLVLIKQPVFYVVLIGFCVFTSFFTFFVNNFFSLEMGSSDLRQFFLSMPYVSLLIIPVLTINIWYNQNDLFKSFPISAKNLVFSKVICLWFAYFVMLFFTIPTVFCVNKFGFVSIPQVFTGYFGILLYSLAIISVCVYIFILLQNKSIALLVSVLAISVINTIHFLPLLIELPSWLSSFARVFSASWHFDSASKGILDSRDCFFYIIFASLFIVLSIEHQTNEKKGKISINSFLYPVIACLLLLNTNFYYVRIDLTLQKQFSLSAETKNTVQNVNSPLQITYYLSKELEELYPQVQDIKEFLYQFSYENSNIKVKTIDPQSKNAAVSTKTLENLGITTQQIQSTESNKTSLVSVYSSILIEYQDKFSVIPFTIAFNTLEYELVTRLKSLTTAFNMEVLLLVGNDLSTQKEYAYVIPWLQTAGFSVKQVSAYDLESTTVSPHQCLVVLGSSELTLNDTVSIETYISNGGNALFAVSANTVDIVSTWEATQIPFDPVIDMLGTWGFAIGKELVSDLSNYRLQMYAANGSNVDYNNSVYINYPFWVVTLPQFSNNNHLITKNFSGLEVYWANPISINLVGDGEYTSLVKTSTMAWLQAPYQFSSEKAFQTEPFSLANQKPDDQTYEQFTVAAIFEGTLPPYYLDSNIQNAKISVISDQYFASTMVENTNSPHNLNFLIDNCLYLSNSEALINIKNKNAVNNNLYKITDEKEFENQKQKTIILTFAIIPTVILFLAITVFVVRKKVNLIQKECLTNKKEGKNENK